MHTIYINAVKMCEYFRNDQLYLNDMNGRHSKCVVSSKTRACMHKIIYIIEVRKIYVIQLFNKLRLCIALLLYLW